MPVFGTFLACTSDTDVAATDAAAGRRGTGDGGLRDVGGDDSQPASEPRGAADDDASDRERNDGQEEVHEDSAELVDGGPPDAPDSEGRVPNAYEGDAHAPEVHEAAMPEPALPTPDGGDGDEVADVRPDAATDAGPEPENLPDASIAAGCGDGVIGLGEACDEGPENSDTGYCTTTCSRAECGDGFVNGAEQCDDGNDSNLDGCVSDCRFNVCGDGYVDWDTEACDDGNDDEFDTCSNDCSSETPCGDPFPPCAVPVCGDGIVDPGEGCDDQNVNDMDACRNDCTVPN